MGAIGEIRANEKKFNGNYSGRAHCVAEFEAIAELMSTADESR